MSLPRVLQRCLVTGRFPQPYRKPCWLQVSRVADHQEFRDEEKQLGSAAQLTFRNTSPNEIKQLEKTGLKQWDFGDLPKTLSFERDGLKVTGYPALEDNIDSVAVKLFDIEREAQNSHRKGVCRLMRFELKEQIKQLEKNLPNFNQYALIFRNTI